jgi:hypothetical protein
MLLSINICAASFALLVVVLRRNGLSLGLPIAYLFALLLIHVPGAIAHMVSDGVLIDSQYTELGMYFTAIASVCYVVGVWLSRLKFPNKPHTPFIERPNFWMFCLAGGWIFTYALGWIVRIPTIGAVVRIGGAIWMLGVMLGLRTAINHRKAVAAVFWACALAVYPIVMLLLGGFLSYGSSAVIIVIAALAISVRNRFIVTAGILVTAVISFNGFLNYFQHRAEMRDAVWGGAPMQDRVSVVTEMIREFQWFDRTNEDQLNALDRRLNQNYFVGLAAARINAREVNYLYGRSIKEGFLALVPRILWPDKPVYGGSPEIVVQMTGLDLNTNTSWGVGNVMEFEINFGVAGVIGGFLILGWCFGWLDRRAAETEAEGRLGEVPGVAMMQPGGSVVEVVGGAGAGLAAGYLWKLAWRYWAAPRFVAGRFERASAFADIADSPVVK